MKRALMGLMAGAVVAGSALAQAPQPGATAPAAAPATAPAAGAAGAGLSTTQQKASYGLGLSLGRNFKSQSIDIDMEILIKGMRDGMAGAKPALTDPQIQEALQAFQQEVMTKQAERAKAEGAANKKAGEDFLKANAAKPGVVTLPSGLQYKVVKEGTGAMPKATDTVTTHYKGTLLDGTQFDSSYDRGEPASFPVGGVIKGWTEALQKMKVGSKWQLFIPAALAYGSSPPPGAPIPPDSTLLFEVELLGIGAGGAGAVPK
jgi:FKBP-type peptidyl-prolyl cis-trans isomerase FklB